MPISDRTQPADYHYLAYSYPGDDNQQPWAVSAPVADRLNYQFSSLRRDLEGLRDEAIARGMPAPELQEIDDGIDADGNRYRVLALSFGAVGAARQREVLFTGGIHAREWIAPAITYLLAEYLVKHYHAAPADQYQSTIHALVNATQIHIVPLLNPAGNWYTVFSPDQDARDWRKNRQRLPALPRDWAAALGDDIESQGYANPPFRNIVSGANDVTYQVPRYPVPADGTVTYDDIEIDLAASRAPYIGVDCNRNFNTSNWGFEPAFNEEGQPSYECYFGTNRNAAPETGALVGFVAGKQIDAAIDFHSYSQLILYAGEGRPPSAADVSAGRALQTLICSRLNPPWYHSYDYQLGTGFDLLGYHALSSVSDYMALARNATAFTIELSPASNDPIAFQLPEDRIMGVFEANIRVALGFIASAGAAPVQVTARNLFNRHSLAGTHYAGFATWNVFGRGNLLPT